MHKPIRHRVRRYEHRITFRRKEFKQESIPDRSEVPSKRFRYKKAQYATQVEIVDSEPNGEEIDPFLQTFSNFTDLRLVIKKL